MDNKQRFAFGEVISRRIEKILLLSKAESWRYCNTHSNPADVASRPYGVKKPESQKLWFEGPQFLMQSKEVPESESPMSVNRVTCTREQSELCFSEKSPLDELIDSAPSLYVLKKRVAYLSAFVEYKRCEFKKCAFVRPELDCRDLEKALKAIVGFVQRRYYGQALRLLKDDSPEGLAAAIERCSSRNTGQPRHWLNELRSLNRFRPCVDSKGFLRIEGRLANSPELSEDMKHPLVLPSKYSLTRLVVLQSHVENSHVGVQHTLLNTRKQFWIVNGNASVKRYLNQCG